MSGKRKLFQVKIRARIAAEMRPGRTKGVKSISLTPFSYHETSIIPDVFVAWGESRSPKRGLISLDHLIHSFIIQS